MNASCSVKLLESALDGHLPEEDEAALHRHLEECEACSAALEQMAGGQGWCREAVTRILRDKLDVAAPARDTWSEVDFTVEHLEPTDEPNMLGRLGGYDVLEIIGHGGMGIVLKAFDRELKRAVAIKVLAPHLAQNSLARKRFAREAQAAAAVVHPHVLAIHQVQPAGRLPFLVMPLVAGESLAQRLKTQGMLELKEILRIGMQAAAGLAAAHEQGLVHRDVKPGNILLETGVERAVLMDFGLARAADDVTLTRWGIIAGTPQYMSPEQARGEPLDARSDLFSLGCVLYEMASGVSPFRTESVMATMRRLIDDSPQALGSLNPELPPWFIAIVDRLLEKDPSRRFSSAQEVSDLLEGCLAHVQQPASVPLPVGLPKPAVRRGWRFNIHTKGVLAMITVSAIGLLGAILLSANPPDIAGQWSGDEWGQIVLKKINDAEYTGTYGDTVGKQTGEIQLKWSRIERRFNGTWREGDDRFGELSLRLTGDQIRGALTTDAKSKINPATPRLADLAWSRAVMDVGSIVTSTSLVRFTTPFDGEWNIPNLPIPFNAGTFLNVVGTVQPPADVSHVWAEAAGTVAEVLVAPGQHVHKGQAIIELDAPDLTDQVEINRRLVRDLQGRVAMIKASPSQPAKEALDIARAEFEKAHALAEFARSEAARFAKLDAKGDVTETVVASARATSAAREAEEKIAKARLGALLEQPKLQQKEMDEAENQLLKAQAQLAKSRQLLRTGTVRSPADGIVLSLNVGTGQFVQPRTAEGASEICQVADVREIEIHAQVSPDDASQIDLDKNVDVEIPGRDAHWTGHLVLPDPETLGNPAVVRVRDPDWRLYRAGALVQLRFRTRAAEGALKQDTSGPEAANQALAIAVAGNQARALAEAKRAQAAVQSAREALARRAQLEKLTDDTALKAELLKAEAAEKAAKARLDSLREQSSRAKTAAGSASLPTVQAFPAEDDSPTARSLTDLRYSNAKTVYLVVTGAVSDTPEPVWGTDIYTDDSSLTAAAVHAGVLREGERGVVKVTFLPGQTSYRGQGRNGVQSDSYGAWPRSFRVEANDAVPHVAAPTPPFSVVPAPRDLTGYFREHVGQSYLFLITGPSENEINTSGNAVWGSDVYTDDSPLAVAAVHTGLLNPDELAVLRVRILPGQESYRGGVRCGVYSSSYGAWGGSYRIEKPTADDLRRVRGLPLPAPPARAEKAKQSKIDAGRRPAKPLSTQHPTQRMIAQIGDFPGRVVEMDDLLTARAGKLVLRHIVAVGSSEILVEALPGGHEFRLVAEVPLAKNPRHIARMFEHICDRFLVGMQALAREWLQHRAVFVAHVQVHATRVTAGHQCRPAGCTDATGDVEAREPGALLGEPIHMGRAMKFRAKTT